MSKSKRTHSLSPHEMGNLLEEFNALKRMISSLFNDGECSVRDMNEAGKLVTHLSQVFNFVPQFDPDDKDAPDYGFDFVFPSDPRAFVSDADDDENETNGDLH